MTKSILLLTSGMISLFLLASCANENASTSATGSAGTQAETGAENVSGVGAGVGAGSVPHIGGH